MSTDIATNVAILAMPAVLLIVGLTVKLIREH